MTPIIGPDDLYLFMEPTSPKGRDLRDHGTYALHNGVPDANGTGGEFSIRGTAVLVDDADVRTIATAAATYAPADRYILFRLTIDEARCGGYGDVELPLPTRWSAA